VWDSLALSALCFGCLVLLLVLLLIFYASGLEGPVGYGALDFGCLVFLLS